MGTPRLNYTSCQHERRRLTLAQYLLVARFLCPPGPPFHILAYVSFEAPCPPCSRRYFLQISLDFPMDFLSA